jgi:hypothetical protein
MRVLSAHSFAFAILDSYTETESQVKKVKKRGFNSSHAAYMSCMSMLRECVLQAGDTSMEAAALEAYAVETGWPCRRIQRARDVPTVPRGALAFGDVAWVESVLASHVHVADARAAPREALASFCPAFLAPWLKRRVWRQDAWPLGLREFVKPADRHKRFTGFVTHGTWRGKRKGPFWCSEVVAFTNEWRFYVAHGKVVATHWYRGHASPCPAPPLDIAWPPDFCGAVDFGSLSNGSVALVEANPPYACGWYGPPSDVRVFAAWLSCGWAWATGARLCTQAAACACTCSPAIGSLFKPRECASTRLQGLPA